MIPLVSRAMAECPPVAGPLEAAAAGLGLVAVTSGVSYIVF